MVKAPREECDCTRLRGNLQVSHRKGTTPATRLARIDILCGERSGTRGNQDGTPFPPHPAGRGRRAALPPAAALDADIGIVHLGLGAFHRAHQAILTQRALAVGAGALGDQRREPARRRRARRAPAAGLPLHADRELTGSDERASVVGVSARRCARPRRGHAARPARRAGDADRHAHRHREGLLPQPGDRRSRPRPSRYPGRSCGRRPAALDPRLARARAHAAAGRCVPAGSPCSAATTWRATAARCAAWSGSSPSRSIASLADLDRGRGPLPEQHGRPDRPGRDGGLARPCGAPCWACATRRR